MNNKNIVFLLGGNDLEMAEIKNLLEVEQIPYQDNNLSWGASWDSYKNWCLDKGKAYEKIYGIELAGDKPAANCILIDHHGKNMNRPASILQVCEIIGINPSRRQELIAANDAGYIPAMLHIGASREEIAQIRREDRTLSGCTEKDEENAQARYDMYGSKDEPIYKAHLYTPKFAPFIDAHWSPKALFIVNAKAGDNKLEVQISGYNAMRYIAKFKSICPSCWYGGGINGYIGGYMDLVHYGILKKYVCK